MYAVCTEMKTLLIVFSSGAHVGFPCIDYSGFSFRLWHTSPPSEKSTVRKYKSNQLCIMLQLVLGSKNTTIKFHLIFRGYNRVPLNNSFEGQNQRHRASGYQISLFVMSHAIVTWYYVLNKDFFIDHCISTYVCKCVHMQHVHSDILLSKIRGVVINFSISSNKK